MTIAGARLGNSNLIWMSMNVYSSAENWVGISSVLLLAVWGCFSTLLRGVSVLGYACAVATCPPCLIPRSGEKNIDIFLAHRVKVNINITCHPMSFLAFFSFPFFWSVLWFSSPNQHQHKYWCPQDMISSYLNPTKIHQHDTGRYFIWNSFWQFLSRNQNPFIHPYSSPLQLNNAKWRPPTTSDTYR